MIPYWLAELIRKTFPPKRLPHAARGRDPLRLEPLEDRSLLSTLAVDPPPATPSDPSTPATTRVEPPKDFAAGPFVVLSENGTVAYLFGDGAEFRGDAFGTGWASHTWLPLPSDVFRLDIHDGRGGASEPVAEAATQNPPAPAQPPATPRPQTTSAEAPPDAGAAATPVVRHVAPPDASAVAVAPANSAPIVPPPAPRPGELGDPAGRLIQPVPAAIPLRGPESSPAPAHDVSAPAELPQAALGGVSDGVLVRRYAAERDQAAFTELVRRHARGVLAVSTRVLGDADRAQDASQATFLALARRAGALDDRGSLGGWLYKVAYRVALRYRVTAARQRRLERAAAEQYPAEADDLFDEVDDADLCRALREELARLPEKYRLPLALCYLDGRTHAEVAAAVGLPRGSVAKRIGEGLDRLREGLAGRGFVM